MGNSLSVAEAYHLFGLIHGAKGNYSVAELFLNESISLNEQGKNLNGLADVYEYYGNLCQKNGHLHNARHYYENALKACTELNLHSKVEELTLSINKLNGQMVED